MVELLWVGLGGFLGAVARHAFGLWLVSRLGSSFPSHTLIVNLTGSFAIGVVLVLFTERFVVDPAWRLLLIVGFLGGYTTFSSYTLEAVAMAERGRWLAALSYVLASNGLGLTATFAGVLLTRTFAR